MKIGNKRNLRKAQHRKVPKFRKIAMDPKALIPKNERGKTKKKEVV